MNKRIKHSLSAGLAIITVGIAFVLTGCVNKNNTITSGPIQITGHQALIYTTADSTNLRLSPTGQLKFEPTQQPLESEVFVFVDPSNTFQKFIGIGGAITDAAAEVFAKLPANRQQQLIDAYYNPASGIGYKIIRTSIHSCDFSSESYTYVEEGDSTLATFSVAHDKQFRIPMIKRALEAMHQDAVVFASPWSPPAFMKDNRTMLQGGKLLPQFYQAWANYFVKFIEAYEKEGIPIWGVTIQNEPMARQIWESCIYTAEEERDFLKYYLGPTFSKAGLKDKNIVVWDHNRDLLPQRASTIFNDPEASKYAWGLGFHWYETWSGGEPMFDNVSAIREAYPDKKLLFTEGCAESFDSTHYQYWPNAERYGLNMISDFNNGTTGWTDWNILLDEKGGPNHVGNFCFAPVHADTRTGELIFTPAFYYIGHFSRFIKPGALRLMATPSRSILKTTSFVNPDGSIATIVMNITPVDVKYKLIAGDGMIELMIPAHAIQTIVY